MCSELLRIYAFQIFFPSFFNSNTDKEILNIGLSTEIQNHAKQKT